MEQIEEPRKIAFLKADPAEWAAIMIVVVGLGVSIFEADDRTRFAAEVLPLGATYLFLLQKWNDFPRLQALGRTTYFVVQLAVLAMVALVFARSRVFGVEWLLFMPLISQSRMELRPLGVFAVCGAFFAILSAHVAWLASWSQVPGVLLVTSTAVVFVLLFTDITMRETKARESSQRLSEELQDANVRLREYAVQAEELAVARERARVAREIHDSVGHSLTAVHMQLEAARALIERDPERARGALDKAQSCVRDGLTEIRASVADLRADPLEGRGLRDALADLVEVGEASGLPATFEVRGSKRRLDAATSLALYRCVQEGLTNARKHAQASRVDVLLDYGDDAERKVRLRIRDDGVGVDGEPAPSGFGLIGLRERLRQLDGRLEIVAAEGEGFALHAEVAA